MYQEYSEIDESWLGDFEQPYYQLSYNWIKWLLLIFMMVTPVIIVFKVGADRIAMCLLAYLNCLLISFGGWRFLQKGTFAAMVPVIFIPMILLSWPVAILYFALFYPESYYKTLTGNVSYFEAGVKVQLCVTLFFIGYFLIMFRVLRNEQPGERVEILHPRRFANIGILLGLSIITVHAVSTIIRFPDFVKYVCDGIFKYMNGLLFIPGILIKDVSKIIRIVLFSSLVFVVFFYTVGNARGWAVRCILMFFFGIVFFSKVSRKTKVILVVSLIFAFPSYLVIANTTRILLGTVGYRESFTYRLQALKEWKTVKRETPEAFATFGRLFYTGGHSIVAQTPSRVPYRRFSPVRYPKEMIEALILQRIYFRPYYRGTQMLIDYGFRIIPGVTSVGISLLGSFWLLGGYVPMFFGGIGLGLLHGFFANILKRAWAVSKVKAIIYLTIFAPSIIWSSRLGFIAHWRDMMYRLAFAFILYQAVRFVVGEAPYEEEKAALEEYPETATDEEYY